MAEPTPKRGRPFQFSLSTVLILTAIAALLVAARPFTIAKTDLLFTPRGEEPRVISTFAGNYGDPGSEDWLHAGATIPQQSSGSYEMASRNLLNPWLILPGLGFVGFVIWKSSQMTFARRRARTVSAPLP